MQLAEKSSPLVDFQDVNFSYKGSKQDVLHKVNVIFRSHSFYFLTGDSGMGKTSFLKLIYNGLLPTTGNISVFGINTKNLNINSLPDFRQQIGIVQQNCELFEHLTIQENVALALKLQGVTAKKANMYAEELLAWSGLGDYLKRFSKELSEGQKQRVAVARAVIREPKLLLADEPTGNVDEAQSKRLIGLFKELVKMGTTVIIATHNRQLVASKGYTEYRLRHGDLREYSALRGTSSLTAQLMRKA